MKQTTFGFIETQNHVRDLAKKISLTADKRYGAWVIETPKQENETVSQAQAKISGLAAEHGYHYDSKNQWKHSNGKTVNISSLVQNDRVLHFLT